MKTISQVKATFNCSLDRAFKTPILGDATKYLTGYGVIPPITKFSEDQSWGKPGGYRIPHNAKNFFSKGGEVAIDKVLERRENDYWKWAVTDFKQPSMRFTKFQGEFFVNDMDDGTVDVRWVYTVHSKGFWHTRFIGLS